MPHAPDLSGCALDGRYELHAVIGEGTFGRVYCGRDRRLARPVAVKVIKPWWAEDPDWVVSFEREVQLLARVNDPGIVQIFDVGHAEEGIYYVAELVDGESLASRLRRGPLPPWEACEVSEQLCLALAQAHGQRVIHRDVKPANVLISSRGRVKVGDFGVARLADASSGAVATIVGTPRYMAPEQARGRSPTSATDVYSVGIVLYEMLAGRPPFVETSAVELALRHLHDPPAPLPAGTPQALVDIVNRALAKDPSRRYPSGGAMAVALGQARVSISAERTPVVGGQPKRASRGPRLRMLPATVPAAGNGGGSAATAATHVRSNGSKRSADDQRIDATRVVVPMTPRRNMNPPARRRSAAALTSAFLLLLSMVAAAILIGGIGHVRIPDLRGLGKTTIAGMARHLRLRAAFSDRYSQVRRGIAIAQTPGAGVRVRDGSTVRVTLSAGLAPVKVPRVVGQAAADAQAALWRLGLRAVLMQVAAPGRRPGVVTGQSPPVGAELLPRSTITLSVAEIPSWRSLTSFAGDGRGRSVPFRIRGTRWRVFYSMRYVGTCTFIVFCSGPSAVVTNLGSASSAGKFDLDNGSGRTHAFDSGAGLYEVRVSPGSDTARWSVEVQDYY